jgi:glycolate oxidase FAD binding subunit
LQALSTQHAGAVVAADDAIWQRWCALFAFSDLLARASVLPSEVMALARQVVELPLADAPAISATVTAGVVRVATSIAGGAAMHGIEQLRAACGAHGGSLVVEAAPIDVKRRIDVFGETRADFELMRRLKQQFDPERVLSPGRFSGRL